MKFGWKSAYIGQWEDWKFRKRKVKMMWLEHKNRAFQPKWSVQLSVKPWADHWLRRALHKHQLPSEFLEMKCMWKVLASGGVKNRSNASLLICCLQGYEKKLVQLIKDHRLPCKTSRSDVLARWSVLSPSFSLSPLQALPQSFPITSFPLKKHTPGLPHQISNKALGETISCVTFTKGNSAWKGALLGWVPVRPQTQRAAQTVWCSGQAHHNHLWEAFLRYLFFLKRFSFFSHKMLSLMDSRRAWAELHPLSSGSWRRSHPRSLHLHTRCPRQVHWEEVLIWSTTAHTLNLASWRYYWWAA